MLKSSLLLLLAVFLLSSEARAEPNRADDNVAPGRPRAPIMSMMINFAPTIGGLQVAALLSLAAAVGVLAQLR